MHNSQCFEIILPIIQNTKIAIAINGIALISILYAAYTLFLLFE